MSGGGVAGRLRWNGSALELCDGWTWQPLFTPMPHILYEAGSYYTGNSLGGRTGADALCSGSGNKPNGYTNFRAFLSVDSVGFGDEIRNMPNNYGINPYLSIQSTNGTTIADNWNDLLDGTIQTSLVSAGVILSGPSWWSGSLTDGRVGQTCNGWTGGTVANYGSSTVFNNDWISLASVSCGGSLRLVCLAY